MSIESALSEFTSPAIIGALIGTLIGLAPILRDTNEYSRFKKFRRQLTAAMKNSKVNYSDLQHMAERWSQDRKAIQQCLRILLSEAISKDDSLLDKKSEEIRELLTQHQDQEPYSELPENISLQLATLTNQNPNSKNAIGQLAASLSELYSSNHNKLSRQTKFTFWGVIFGLIGAGVGIISWFT